MSTNYKSHYDPNELNSILFLIYRSKCQFYLPAVDMGQNQSSVSRVRMQCNYKCQILHAFQQSQVFLIVINEIKILCSFTNLHKPVYFLHVKTHLWSEHSPDWMLLRHFKRHFIVQAKSVTQQNLKNKKCKKKRNFRFNQSDCCIHQKLWNITSVAYSDWTATSSLHGVWTLLCVALVAVCIYSLSFHGDM